VTIRKGEEWGAPVDRPAMLRFVGSDAEVVEAYASGDEPDIAVIGGDLRRSIGEPTDRARMQRLPIDLVDIVTDGVATTAVAHVIARRSWWRGPIIAVMNVDHLGEWNLAPKAHPNDGRVDVVEVDPNMPMRARWQARSRLPTGTHLPHPAIATRQVREMSWDFDRPLGIWVDGDGIGDTRNLTVRVRPDAAAVYV